MQIFEIIIIASILVLFLVSIIILVSQNKLKHDSERRNEILQNNINKIIKEQFVEIVKNNAENSKNQIKENNDNTQKLTEIITTSLNGIKETNNKKLEDIQEHILTNAKEQIKENNENTQKLADRIKESLTEIRETNNKKLEDIQEHILTNAKEQIKENNENTQKLADRIKESLTEIRETNEKKLEDIQKNVNEKLDKSLNERLDSSFKTISDGLKSLYQNLGELKTLSQGVDSLSKTLSNVKTRGIYGEAQLDNILANIMDDSQYEKQFKLNKNENSIVDFAIKIPDKLAENKFLYLPIDSKFPYDKYINVVDAYAENDLNKIKNSLSDLKTAVETQAKSIRSKYLNPPITTNFAIMFLPTESLYAEVLRIDGLYEKCLNEYNIVIQGPTTITALINSFSIGFKYLVINKKTAEIEKTLQAIKKQFDIFSDLIDKTERKLTEAQNITSNLSKRNKIINKNLKSLEEISLDDSEKILGIDDKYEDIIDEDITV